MHKFKTRSTDLPSGRRQPDLLDVPPSSVLSRVLQLRALLPQTDLRALVQRRPQLLTQVLRWHLAILLLTPKDCLLVRLQRWPSGSKPLSCHRRSGRLFPCHTAGFSCSHRVGAAATGAAHAGLRPAGEELCLCPFLLLLSSAASMHTSHVAVMLQAEGKLLELHVWQNFVSCLDEARR